MKVILEVLAEGVRTDKYRTGCTEGDITLAISYDSHSYCSACVVACTCSYDTCARDTEFLAKHWLYFADLLIALEYRWKLCLGDA